VAISQIFSLAGIVERRVSARNRGEIKSDAIFVVMKFETIFIH
jgi:hypothetical protein